MTHETQRIAIAPVWERFWSKVVTSESSRCWPWIGAKNELGYGQFNFDGKITRAPRVAFLSRHGWFPENACHRCDNPTCCNPDHIFDGTHADNMRDMTVKGRFKTDRSEKHGRAVLTDQKVLGMRGGMATLATKYGCSFGAVQRVIARKTWAFLRTLGKWEDGK